MNIYVGNLSRDVTDEDLQAAFEAYGKVTSSKVIKDNYSGQSRGFGFVEMPDNSEADAAVKALNGEELKGQRLKLSEARPRTERRHGGRSGGSRHSGGMGGGRYR